MSQSKGPAIPHKTINITFLRKACPAQLENANASFPYQGRVLHRGRERSGWWRCFLTSCAILTPAIHTGMAGICDRFLPSLGQMFLVKKAIDEEVRCLNPLGSGGRVLVVWPDPWRDAMLPAVLGVVLFEPDGGERGKRGIRGSFGRFGGGLRREFAKAELRYSCSSVDVVVRDVRLERDRRFLRLVAMRRRVRYGMMFRVRGGRVCSR